MPHRSQKHHPLPQLDLLSPEAHALADLHAEYRGLAQAHEELFTQVTALRQEVRTLQTALQAKELELTHVRATARAQLDVAYDRLLQAQLRGKPRHDILAISGNLSRLDFQRGTRI